MPEIQLWGRKLEIEPADQCAYCKRNLGSVTCEKYPGKTDSDLIPEEYRHGPGEKRDCPYFLCEENETPC